MAALLAGLVLERRSTSPDLNQRIGWIAAWIGWAGATLYGMGFTFEVWSPVIMDQAGFTLFLMMLFSFPVMFGAAVVGIAAAVAAVTKANTGSSEASSDDEVSA
jgi:hypothetical protein